MKIKQKAIKLLREAALGKTVKGKKMEGGLEEKAL